MSVELRDLGPVSSVLALLGAPQPQGPWPSKPRSSMDSPSNYYIVIVMSHMHKHDVCIVMHDHVSAHYYVEAKWHTNRE